MNCGDSPCGINEIDDKPCTCDMMEYEDNNVKLELEPHGGYLWA